MIRALPMRRSRAVPAVALVALALLAGVASPVGAAAAPVAKSTGDGRATFGIGPAASSTAKSFFTYQSAAGGRYSDRAVVANYGPTPLTLSVYATDLGNDPSGQVVVGNGPSGNHDAGAWVSLSKPTLNVRVPAATGKGPGSTQVPFTFHVPADAEPGDHGAALVAVLSTTTKNAKGQPVRLNQRVGTRIYIRVAGTVRPSLSVQQLSASYSGTWSPLGHGTATVRYTIKNTGNIRLGATSLARVSGWWGGDHTVTAPSVPLLFPGAEQQVTVRLHGVTPAFREHARVTVTPVLLADEPVVASAKATAESDFTAIPWGAIVTVLLLLVVLAVALLLVLRRRRQRRQRVETGRTSHRHVRNARPAKHHSRAARTNVSTVALGAGVLGVLVTGVLSAAGPAQAAAPFHDPAVKGYLGFCNAAGKQVTSGSTTAHPFVTQTVSTLAASGQYAAEKGGKATLYAYQPRKGVDPGDWSGRLLTASSFYSSSAHPMAAGTPLDYSLADFLSIYPAQWDGLVQLRLYLSAPNQPQQLYPYAATTVQVSGSTWKVVDGGAVNCSSGKTRSSETVNLSPQQYKAQLQAVQKQRAVQASAAAKAGGNGSGGRSASSSPSAGAASDAPPASQGGGGSPAAQTRRTSSDSDGSATLWVVVGIAVALALATGVTVVRRRSRSAG